MAQGSSAVIVSTDPVGGEQPSAARFDLETFAWEVLPSPPSERRRYAAGIAVDDWYIVWGGAIDEVAPIVVYVDGEASWRQHPPSALTNRSGARVIALPIGGLNRLYVTATSDNDRPLLLTTD
jgi:hypothetical protein